MKIQLEHEDITSLINTKALAELLFNDMQELFAKKQEAEILWDVNDVAEYLGLAPNTVRDKTCKRSDFPKSFNKGKRKLWKKQAIIEWHKK